MATGHSRRRLIALLLVATACTQTPAVTTSTSVPLTPSTTASVASQVFELAEQVSHPNGAQLRVDRVELLPDSTVVTATITNGSPFELLIGGGTTELRPDSGPAIALLDGLDSVSVAPSGDIVLNLRFGPVQGSPAVTLALDEGGGSSPTSPKPTAPRSYSARSASIPHKPDQACQARCPCIGRPLIPPAAESNSPSKASPSPRTASGCGHGSPTPRLSKRGLRRASPPVSSRTMWATAIRSSYQKGKGGSASQPGRPVLAHSCSPAGSIPEP